METGRKTEQQYWDDLHAAAPPRMRLPSALRIDALNFMRLMRAHVRPGMRVLEVGFAPGKYLAWVGKVLQSNVAGVDYAASGVDTARRLFEVVDLKGDLRCEDFFETSFRPGSFDIVYSLGVIEHFDDPRPIVRKHVELLAPGGKALIVIPNYRGVYGTVQRYFDPANLDLHNTDIMSTDALRRVAPTDLPVDVDVFAFGRLVPGLICWHMKLPNLAVQGIGLAVNTVGLLQPRDWAPACPWLVLRISSRAA